MKLAEVTVKGIEIYAKELHPITSGMIGATVGFTFDESWDALEKIVVFQAGKVAKDVIGVTDWAAVTVPWEVLEKSGTYLRVGVYGYNADKTLAIPTKWTNVGHIKIGADPSSDPAADPSLPIYAELDQRVEALEQGGTGGGGTNDYSKIIDQLQQDVAELKYVPIEITSISNNVGKKECGTVLDTMTISWVTNKQPVSQTISTGHTLTPDQRSDTLDDAELSGVTAEKALTHTFRVTVTDERGETDKADTSVVFQNRVYYGTAAPSALDRAFILALPNSVMTDTRKRSFQMNDEVGKYTWYAVPVRLGPCSFKVNGFDGGFNEPSIIMFENALGYKENYFVYRSEYDGQSGVTVEVI